jgi:hypothetical protein
MWRVQDFVTAIAQRPLLRRWLRAFLVGAIHRAPAERQPMRFLTERTKRTILYVVLVCTLCLCAAVDADFFLLKSFNI